jgi:hypothetical protein
MIRIHKTLVKKEVIAGIGDGRFKGEELCIRNLSRNIKITCYNGPLLVNSPKSGPILHGRMEF